MFAFGDQNQIQLTPLDQIRLIRDDVADLIKMGVMKKEQGSALTYLLEAGINQFYQKDVDRAISLLQAFISKIDAQVNEGELSQAHGEGLIDAANDIIIIAN